MKMLKYGKTTDFKMFLRNIESQVRFEGLDENEKPIYNNEPLPTVTLKGTVKLHGTNAAVSLQDNKIVCMSRNNIVDSGHNGFVEMVNNNEEVFIDMFQTINAPDGIIPTIYGEWAGEGIQKGVGVAQFEKCFYLFGVRLTKIEGEEQHSVWLDSIQVGELFGNDKIKNIHQFPTYSIKVDLNNPKESQNQLIDITNLVEKDCPVSRQLAIEKNLDVGELVGEGVVWECFIGDVRHNFKVKGEKHSVSKVKTLVEIDPIKLASVNEFVERVVTENRVKQAMSEVVPRDVMGVSKQDTGAVLKWLMSDVLAEESQVLYESNLEVKDVAPKLNSTAKSMFFKLLDEL